MATPNSGHDDGDEAAPRYRQEGGVWLIDIKLSTVQQLFNSFDPSPFYARDIDADAEAWIVGAVRDFPLAAPLKLVLHLPANDVDAAGALDLERALASYFGDRYEGARRDLRYLLRTGRYAFFAGLSFLAVCLGLRQLLLTYGGGVVSDIASEGLLIIGWVAMWRPVEIFLYDWWPIRRMSHVYAKAASLPVEIRAREIAAEGTDAAR